MTRTAIIGGRGKGALELSGILSKEGVDVTSVIRNPDHRDDAAAIDATPLMLDVELSTEEARRAVAGTLRDGLVGRRGRRQP